jgi:hypothetical protein
VRWRRGVWHIGSVLEADVAVVALQLVRRHAIGAQLLEDDRVEVERIREVDCIRRAIGRRAVEVKRAVAIGPGLADVGVREEARNEHLRQQTCDV